MDQSQEQSQLPHEVSQDPVEIRQEDAITIAEALLLAGRSHFSIGKSTLQRWAKVWEGKGSKSPVKCIFVTTRAGNFYKLDRQDFEAWVLEQKDNDRSHEVLGNLERSDETSSGSTRPSETSQEFTRPSETSHKNFAPQHDPENEARIRQLEDENLQLKIDIGVRRELIKQAREEMDRLRSASENLLRENGALEFQIRQLPPAPQAKTASPPVFENRAGEQEYNRQSANGDNQSDAQFSGV